MSPTNDLISIGSLELDTLLGGGIRRGTTCLLEELEGESSGVSGVLGFDFLFEGIKRGDGAILLLSEHTIKEYTDLPGAQTILSNAQPGQFIFMDALSSMTFGEPPPNPDAQKQGIIQCSNVRYAPKFYEEIRTAVSSLTNPIMYIDSLSVLLHAMESDKVAWRFWLSLLPLIRRRDLTITASFYPEMHSRAFVESIERICDTIIHFSTRKTNTEANPRSLQVIKNRGLEFDDRIHNYILKQFKFHFPKE
jgi:archaellum biogenesis ATPase FlaH